ncbi:enoyl-CoA hydratase [Halioglobus maricola]|uniref:Enoyl-CoA hydratase n=1 Tax=Halioglobus maricola TaxID=2601894 RepID=A0A5P9NIN4_9GAMM|nr:enoyl-CoA hydratase [Halioglobus maricola]QFU75415.1 enoyl-CoA hydratase [Halioglobus maricola]
MPNQSPVLTEISDGVMLITLNRPQSLNAMSKGLVDGVVAAMKQAEADENVKVIVITGAGKAFCAGVDLKELSEGGDVLEADSELQTVFPNCSKPIIGAINGVAVTGGLELALNFDFLYAADTARIGDTHAKVGLMPTWGMSQKLSRIIGINRAREMSLSGALIDAQTAMDWGLVNKVCKPENLLQEVMDKAREIAANHAEAVAGIRKLINDGWCTSLSDGLKLEGERSQPFNDALDFSVMGERLGQVKKSNR